MNVMRRLSTGAPGSPPAWQIICEFANGICQCAGSDKPPCRAAEIAALRVETAVLQKLANEKRARRRGGLPK